MLKSLEITNINDNEMRKFTAWGSVEVKDRHGEIIPIEEVHKVMDYWMAMDSPINFNHTTQKVGKGLSWSASEKNGKSGVLITGMIYKYYKEQDEIWSRMLKGEFEGLSIGGKAEKVEKDGQVILQNLLGYEFSVVERCGNQEATFVEMNSLAKKDKMVEEIKKEDAPETSESSQGPTLEELAQALSNVIARMESLEQKVAGTPEGDEEVVEEAEEETEEESEEDSEEETEKAEEEESEEKSEEEETEKAEEEESEEKPKEDDKVEKQLKVQAKEIAELKKQLSDSKIVKLVKADRPATKKVGEQKLITQLDVAKGLATVQEYTNQKLN